MLTEDPVIVRGQRSQHSVSICVVIEHTVWVYLHAEISSSSPSVWWVKETYLDQSSITCLHSLWHWVSGLQCVLYHHRLYLIQTRDLLENNCWRRMWENKLGVPADPQYVNHCHKLVHKPVFSTYVLDFTNMPLNLNCKNVMSNVTSYTFIGEIATFVASR